MVVSQSEARSSGASAYWLDYQTRIQFSQDPSRPGWSDVVFAFHDRDEIGPKMLARVAKHTGLEPKDL